MSRESGTTGGRLHLELDRSKGALGRQLESEIRLAVTSGRLAPGTQLPSSRTLAGDLGVSRRLVVDAYAQLSAEGWIVAQQGAGTVVARGGSAVPQLPDAPATRQRLPYDFFPGAPDLSSFPRTEWLRALRGVLHDAPDAALHYPDPAGAPELRAALAAHLARSRGVIGDAGRVVVVSGARQGLTLLGRALVRSGVRTLAVELPSLPLHADSLRASGLDVVGVPVDDEGLQVEALARSGAEAVVVTPAHQFPMGVALSPDRRAALLQWATQRAGRLVIEDDYDAEYRYDRRPVGALQALDPERVVYLGSASKTLAPGLRLGWIVAAPALRDALAREKELDDGGSPVLEQLALAQLLESAAYDRHIRLARREYRRRRDALAAALNAECSDARLEGLAAGLHAIARFDASFPIGPLVQAAAARGVAVYPLGPLTGTANALIMGYAGLSEAAIAEGVRRLAEALASLKLQA